MTNAQFEALLRLIDSLIATEGESNAHPSDGPRQKRIREEREAAIQEAKEELVDEDWSGLI